VLCAASSNTATSREPTLTDPKRQFDQRIDLILVRGAKPLAARRVGTRPIATTPPRWASDHAGVVADVRLAKRRLS
jgi:endonuclease/exonuclease/phosphatase family metal-dependent hydrolase